MSNIMELIEAYAVADLLEHRALETGTAAEFDRAIKIKQKARAAVVEAVEKLERDAARYRWLRDSKIEDDAKEWLCVGLFDMCGVVEVDGKELDYSIDAALEATNGQDD